MRVYTVTDMTIRRFYVFFFLKLQFHTNNLLNWAFDNLQLVFTHQKCIARLGLMHLCCTNLAVWFRCIILETLDVLSGYHHRGSGKTGPENVTEIPLIKSSAASRKLLGSKYYYQMLKQLLFTKFFSTIQITLQFVFSKKSFSK